MFTHGKQNHKLKITASQIGKKYHSRWLFKSLDIQINPGASVAITGKNGAGKSTLLQILGGYLTPTAGEVCHNDTPIDIEKCNSTLVGPYTEVIEEMTLREFLTFHSYFKKPLEGIERMAEKAGLPLHMQISEFSTGMKQRTQLITAFYFQNDLLLLDEPSSNLDEDGIRWFAEEVSHQQQTLIIASNDAQEIQLCDQRITL